MASPLTVTRNDYHTNKKSSTIYTPVAVAKFLFDTLHPRLCKGGSTLTVLDPAIGTGRLTDPWFDASYRVIGCDVKPSTVLRAHQTIKGKFEDCTWYDDWPSPDLVLCNPPFNGVPR